MSDITVNNFKAFYEQIRPYLGAAHSGFTPIGTVISVMGTTAPLNYLACDGTAYNISDYPELAAYFNQQFGASNHFGGNGTTTFAVPTKAGGTDDIYCIASKNIFMDAGSNYSTEEQVVGTWIDGSYVYQRTYINLDITTSPNAWTNTNIDLPNNWNTFIKFMVKDCVGVIDYFSMNGEDGKTQLYNSRNSNQHVDTITIQYTKTS